VAASSDHSTGADVAEPPAKRASRVARARAGFQEADVRVIEGPGGLGVRGGPVGRPGRVGLVARLGSLVAGVMPPPQQQAPLLGGQRP
jgi:hypothetical protein